jgi:hypothetical protein
MLYGIVEKELKQKIASGKYDEDYMMADAKLQLQLVSALLQVCDSECSRSMPYLTY